MKYESKSETSIMQSSEACQTLNKHNKYLKDIKKSSFKSTGRMSYVATTINNGNHIATIRKIFSDDRYK